MKVTAGERYIRLAHHGHINAFDSNPRHVRMELVGVRGVARAGAGAGAGAVGNGSNDVREGAREWVGGSVQVIYGRTKLTRGSRCKPWRKKVYSELPYVLTVFNRRYSVSAVVVDEERILGLKVRCVFFLQSPVLSFCSLK
jgi:hypothetical protein